MTDDAISELEEYLIAQGFSNRIVSDHWEDVWTDRKHFKIIGTTSMILEITCANTYLRIWSDEAELDEHNLNFFQVTSTDYPRRPKTDFLVGSHDQLRCLHLEEIKRELGALVKCVTDKNKTPLSK